MNFNDLQNPELQEKLKAAKAPEDILALAKEEGFELTDKQLDGVAGGWSCDIYGKHTGTVLLCASGKL